MARGLMTIMTNKKDIMWASISQDFSASAAADDDDDDAQIAT